MGRRVHFMHVRSRLALDLEADAIFDPNKATSKHEAQRSQTLHASGGQVILSFADAMATWPKNLFNDEVDLLVLDGMASDGLDPLQVASRRDFLWLSAWPCGKAS